MTQQVNLGSQPIDPAAAMGFPTLETVTSLQSVAHLFGMTKKRCGIYFLAFRAGLFYVGQAVDVVRRFSQHRRVHDDIVGFSFIPVPKPALDDTEKALIFKAEFLGLKITNAVHVTNVVGDTDFDLVVSAAEQKAWLDSPARITATAPIGLKIELPEAQQVRFSKHFSRFEKHLLSQRALALLKQYVGSCVPAPRRTEYSFWAVSCMPSGSSNAWPRLLCVNAAFMELFVLGWKRDNANVLWSFVNVAEDVLLEHWTSLNKLAKAFPFLRVERSCYRDAGQHQLRIHCDGGAPMEQLLTDPGIAKAAAVLVLRVMRKRATIYGKYHCAQLANLALSA
ncbi:MAG: GIY-YIG nuclease family protein [Burkholderiaceae bacterium]|nr:GIY-YIG nuclease family protein [Burkholderiaceae bacterium]